MNRVETLGSRTARDEIILGIEQAKAHLAYWAHLRSVQHKLPMELRKRIGHMTKLHQAFLDTGEARLRALEPQQEEEFDLA